MSAETAALCGFSVLMTPRNTVRKEFLLDHPCLTSILRLMIKWLFFLLLFGYSPWSIVAQGTCAPSCTTGNTPGLTMRSSAVEAGTVLSESPNNPLFNAHFLSRPLLFSPHLPPAPVAGKLLPKWTPDELPFFCRVEHDMGKKLPFAFKFRLGSVEYVDWLEGKSTWINP